MLKFDVNKDVKKRLNFKPDEAIGNFCIGVLQSVRVETNTISETTKKGEVNTYEFAGVEVPHIRFEFKQVNPPGDKGADRYFTHIESVIISRTNKGEDIAEDKVNKRFEEMWERLIHLHKDGFGNQPNYKPLGEYKAIEKAGTALFKLANSDDAEAKAKAFTAFYEAVAVAFNSGKDDKPIYGEAKTQHLTMKLIAAYPDRKYYAFPTFVGKGFIEPKRMIDNKLVSNLEFARDESVMLAVGGAAPVVKGSANKEDAFDGLDPEVARMIREQQA